MLAQPYDFNKMISLGILDSAASSAVMYKFTPFNSALSITFIKFVEITFRDATTNALIFPYYAPFKWITVTSCQFYLRQQLIMT